MSLDKEQVEQIVEKAVHTTLLKLGFNIGTPDDVVEQQKDMAYLRATRVRREAMENKAWLHGVGIVLTGIAAATWLAITNYRGH